MKRKAFVLLSGSLICSLLLCACSGSSGGSGQGGSDQTYQLTMTHHDPPTSASGSYFAEWAENIRNASNGRLDITIHPSGTIVNVTGALDAVKSGAADIAWVTTSVHEGQFPLVDVLTLPLFGIKTIPHAANVLWSLYEEFEAVRDELSDFKILMMYSTGVYDFGTRDKPIRSLADMNGMQMRVTNGTTGGLVTGWGGTPIYMPPSDVYEGMQKGVIDGYVWEFSGIDSFKLTELSNYYTIMRINVAPFILMMSLDAWNNLPQDLQATLDSFATREISVEIATRMQAFCVAGEENAAKAGGEIITLSDKDFEEFLVFPRQIVDEWVATRSAGGFDARAYLDRTLELIEQFSGT
ncbi:MAG: TRAP transporter substrate-binding protein [Oscillospiraceae bacterium]|nr:TRAP transporter substrate-binding protein [Oscillospiraceae bacterium]